MRRASQQEKIKVLICRNLSLIDKITNGPICRICGKNPGTLAYHVLPAHYGNSLRMSFDNVVWACRPCNEKERHWRGPKMDEIHEKIFGKKRMNRLRAMIHETKQYSMSDLKDRLKALRESLCEMGKVPF